MRLRRPLPAVPGDTLHIVGVGDNRIGKVACLFTITFFPVFVLFLPDLVYGVGS